MSICSAIASLAVRDLKRSCMWYGRLFGRPGGTYRLVGVEFIILADVWANQHPNGDPPALDGNLLNYVAFPNRFGLPAFYEHHV
jgi:hypothetical protein